MNDVCFFIWIDNILCSWNYILFCVYYSWLRMWHSMYRCLFCFIRLHSIFEIRLHWYGKITMVKSVHYNWYPIIYSLSNSETFDSSPPFQCYKQCCSKHSYAYLVVCSNSSTLHFWKYNCLLTGYAQPSFSPKRWHTVSTIAGLARPTHRQSRGQLKAMPFGEHMTPPPFYYLPISLL